MSHPIYVFISGFPHTGRTHQIRVHLQYMGKKYLTKYMTLNLLRINVEPLAVPLA